MLVKQNTKLVVKLFMIILVKQYPDKGDYYKKLYAYHGFNFGALLQNLAVITV